MPLFENLALAVEYIKNRIKDNKAYIVGDTCIVTVDGIVTYVDERPVWDIVDEINLTFAGDLVTKSSEFPHDKLVLRFASSDLVTAKDLEKASAMVNKKSVVAGTMSRVIQAGDFKAEKEISFSKDFTLNMDSKHCVLSNLENFPEKMVLEVFGRRMEFGSVEEIIQGLKVIFALKLVRVEQVELAGMYPKMVKSEFNFADIQEIKFVQNKKGDMIADGNASYELREAFATFLFEKMFPTDGSVVNGKTVKEMGNYAPLPGKFFYGGSAIDNTLPHGGVTLKDPTTVHINIWLQAIGLLCKIITNKQAHELMCARDKVNAVTCESTSFDMTKWGRKAYPGYFVNANDVTVLNDEGAAASITDFYGRGHGMVSMILRDDDSFTSEQRADARSAFGITNALNFTPDTHLNTTIAHTAINTAIQHIERIVSAMH